MNVVEIRSLTRTFGRSTALADISFSVPDGSICGLFGRNGAGKTTIMSIIAGQDRPTSGKVAVFGERPFENESILAKISFVRDNQRYPDNYQLHHVLRIAPDFAPNWNEEVANELVDGLRIPAKTPIKKFSRGQLSSVAIVLGLASRAPLTLLDEPYLGLDVTARALFHDMLLRDYTAHPRTVILSTHLIEESEALFDRVLIVDRGRVRVDSDIEHTGELAYTLSGSTDAIDRLSVNRTILQSHSVDSCDRRRSRRRSHRCRLRTLVARRRRWYRHRSVVGGNLAAPATCHRALTRWNPSTPLTMESPPRPSSELHLVV